MAVRVHDLKNIDVDLPHDRLVVITVLSGAGTSSLALDTIYAAVMFPMARSSRPPWIAHGRSRAVGDLFAMLLREV